MFFWFSEAAYLDTQALQAAKDSTTNQDKVIDLFYRIGCFFQRLVEYTKIKPTTAMTDLMVAIMVEVLTTLAIAANEVKCGRLSESTLLIFTILESHFSRTVFEEVDGKLRLRRQP